jgi:hypothetical protein
VIQLTEDEKRFLPIREQILLRRNPEKLRQERRALEAMTDEELDAYLAPPKSRSDTMKKLLVAAAVAGALAGCAMSTGILPAGPDTYTVTERFAPVRGGSTTAQQTALTEANAFCAGQGRQFLPVDMLTPASANPYGPTSYSVTFRCLLSGDPELSGSHLAPTQIIEQ